MSCTIISGSNGSRRAWYLWVRPKRSPSSLYRLGRHLMPTLLMTGRRLSNGSLAQLDTDRHELFTVPSQADSFEADEATRSWTAAVVP